MVTFVFLETLELFEGLVIETVGNCVSMGVGEGVSVGVGVAVGDGVKVGVGVAVFVIPNIPIPFGDPNPVGPSNPEVPLHMVKLQIPFDPATISCK